MKARVSVANLATYMTSGSTRCLIGLLNRKTLVDKGRLMYTAIGGAAEMTVYGKRILETAYSADFQDGLDARFVVDEVHLEEIMRLFEGRDRSIYEITLEREVVEELTGIELPGIKRPILTKAQAVRITSSWTKSVRQVPGEGDNNSARAGDMPTYRLLNLFEIAVPEDLLSVITSSPDINGVPVCRLISVQEAMAGSTTNGIAIGGNLVW